MPLNLSSPKRRQGPSLTPLIDVVFILLLFFMLSSTFVRWQTLATPLASSQATASEMPSLSWQVVDNQGGLQVKGQYLHLEHQQQLSQLLQQHPEHLMLIEAADDIELQSLLALADRLHLLGAKQVSITNALRAPMP